MRGSSLIMINYRQESTMVAVRNLYHPRPISKMDSTFRQDWVGNDRYCACGALLYIFPTRPVLQGFTQRDCLRTDVLVQLTAARHGNYRKGMEMQGAKNPRRDYQIHGGQVWLPSLAEMGALLNYSVILYLLDDGLCTTTHTLLRALTRTRNEASSELESSKGHDKVASSCGDSETSLGHLASRTKQIDRALSEMTRPLVRFL
ncbi:hypothetical protein J3F84DRAFT_301839 [Trichoderma pleuroticola]